MVRGVDEAFIEDAQDDVDTTMAMRKRKRKSLLGILNRAATRCQGN